MFFPYYYFDPTMLILIPGVLIALWASFRVQSNFGKYSRVPSRSGISASDMAREILAAQGIYNVRVEQVRGTLTDHYDPSAQALRLSDSVGNSNSLAALAVAAHEAGHVLQHKDGYKPLVLRNAAAPVIGIGSNLAIPLFVIGLIFSWQPLVQIGILLFSLVVLFSLITLPVEFNASKRALAILEGNGYLAQDELPGAKKVLSAAAMTYVASALSAILSLVRLLIISGAGRNDD
jgi:Zn-dependent membrane protease YugP